MIKNPETMQEVDRRYHLNETSEGRINHIADYVEERVAQARREIVERAAQIVENEEKDFANDAECDIRVAAKIRALAEND